MQRRTCLVLVAACAVLPGPAAGAVIEHGVSFDERMQLAGAELLLNGTGVRAVAWLTGYAAGLYLAEHARTADEAVAASGPKRIRMVMLMGAPATEFIKAFDKGVRRNVSAAEAEVLRGRMAQFDAILDGIGKVTKGDIVDMDYEPGRGMTLSYNGAARSPTIRGGDFYAALLLTFIGERPYDKRLRAGLLGGQT